jgi:xanthine dehydrogenase YagT iron-sulfur-binding subunit
LTGTKKGCNQGAGGSCTVLLNGKRINACLTLAVMHDGASITTIEGLEKDGELHPLQQAFIQHDAFQCGYCTPGQIISGSACIDEGHARSADEIKTWMSGNICAVAPTRKSSQQLLRSRARSERRPRWFHSPMRRPLTRFRR